VVLVSRKGLAGEGDIVQEVLHIQAAGEEHRIAREVRHIRVAEGEDIAGYSLAELADTVLEGVRRTAAGERGIVDCSPAEGEDAVLGEGHHKVLVEEEGIVVGRMGVAANLLLISAYSQLLEEQNLRP
jgi:hypothetical protein